MAAVNNPSTYQGFNLAADPTAVAIDDIAIPRNHSTTIAEDAVEDENGRTYHGYSKGTYFLPNDPTEQDRLDYQHKLYVAVTGGKLGRAPAREPRTVLDVATGTGIWAQQYAEAHPNARVIGSDLSLIQRPHNLRNLRFVQHDAENDKWSFPHKFDYIHLRFVVTCFNDTQKVIREAYRNLNPGGWLEFYDAMSTFVSVDGTLEGTAIEEWNRRVVSGGKKLGRDLAKPRKYAQWCHEAGFVDVTEELVAMPSNAWPKDPKLKKLGALNVRNQTCLVDTLTKLLDRDGLEDVADFERRAKEDIRNPNIHFVAELGFVYARKPEYIPLL